MSTQLQQHNNSNTPTPRELHYAVCEFSFAFRPHHFSQHRRKLKQVNKDKLLPKPNPILLTASSAQTMKNYLANQQMQLADVGIVMRVCAIRSVTIVYISKRIPR